MSSFFYCSKGVSSLFDPCTVFIFIIHEIYHFSFVIIIITLNVPGVSKMLVDFQMNCRLQFRKFSNKEVIR